MPLLRLACWLLFGLLALGFALVLFEKVCTLWTLRKAVNGLRAAPRAWGTERDKAEALDLEGRGKQSDAGSGQAEGASKRQRVSI